MSKIYNDIEANSVYDYIYKWLLEDIRQYYEIRSEGFQCGDFDINEYMRFMYDDFFEYIKEVEKFAEIFKDDFYLNEDFCDIFPQICFANISENQRPNGFLVNFVNNLTFKRALKIIDKISFHFGEATTMDYDGKEHIRIWNNIEELPQYKQDICHTINSMIGAIKDTVNFRIRMDIEDIGEDIKECIEGFKRAFGDDVENLLLKDESILHAVIIALNRKLLNCSLNEAGEELGKLLYNAGVNYMHYNDNKSPVEVEPFNIWNETSALCDRNKTPKKEQKAKGARI